VAKDKCKFRFVLTSRFNQDIVENWFSCIRGKGRNNVLIETTREYKAEFAFFKKVQTYSMQRVAS